MLNPRAIALQGIGFTPVSIAALGLLSIEAPPVVQPVGGSFSNRPWRDVPFLPVRPRRPRKRRDAELLLMAA